MTQPRCPRCGTPSAVEQCPVCGTPVPPTARAIVDGEPLLTHGRTADAVPPPAADAPRPVHRPDEADRTVEIPLIPATPDDRTPGPEAASSPAAPFLGEAAEPAPAAPGDGFVPSAPQRPGSRTPALVAGLGVVAVIALALVLALVWSSPGVDGIARPAPGIGVPSPSTPAPAPTTEASVPSSGAVDSGTPSPSPTASGSSSSGPASSATPSRKPSSSAPPSPSSSAAPVPPAVLDIACQEGGWIVQLASAVDEPSYQARLAELRELGQLPDGVWTAQTGSSCPIFTAQNNTIVLWAGVYGSPYDACPARWAGPPDAFVRGTTPDTGRQYVSCLCPADVASLPVLQAGSTEVAVIGELQRVLGNRLNTSIGDLPGNWGTWTPGTQAAVTTFQTEKGLPATGVVDAATWAALNAAQC